MTISRTLALTLGLALLCGSARAAVAQTSLLVNASPIVITAPTESDYTATLSATTTVTVTLDCRTTGGGNNACQVEWSYNGSTLLLDYQITSAGSGCKGGTTMASMVAVPTLAGTKLAEANNKNSTCVFALAIRVRALSITSYLAGVNYLQGLTMTARRL
jgi:hypothetical protein